jgi:molybdate transport system substrate-binding protein
MWKYFHILNSSASKMTIEEENPMRMRAVVAAANIGCICLLLVGIAAEAAELKVLSAGTLRAVMEDLGPKFERATGHKLAFTFAGTGALVKRVQEGETADVVVIPQEGIDSFVKDGKAVAGNVTVVASSSISVAVRKGTPKPDISSPDALKRTLLAAKSITYADPARGGAAGSHFATVLERLGITNEMHAKTVFPHTWHCGWRGGGQRRGRDRRGATATASDRWHRGRRPAAG